MQEQGQHDKEGDCSEPKVGPAGPHFETLVGSYYLLTILAEGYADHLPLFQRR